MRLIYEQKKINWKIQQGAIINNCVSEDYPNVDVWGVIITPRCDIGNNKVSTIHYLPIIKFEDWLKNDFVCIFKKALRQNLRGSLISKFREYGISPTILDNNVSKDDILIIIKSKISGKPLSPVVEILETLFFLGDPNSTIDLLKKYAKLKDSILKDIKEGKDKNFHLIEDWNEKGKYRVVLLRDVRRITFKLAEKISNSIFESEISDEEWKRNDIKTTNIPDTIICIESQLKSPFIEHLIQLFFHNFGRIGVEDMHKEVIEEISSLTVNTLNL